MDAAQAVADPERDDVGAPPPDAEPVVGPCELSERASASQLPLGQSVARDSWDASGSEDDEPCCRICRQGDEAGKLYCPCRCAGSIKWIHESCLKVWLKAQDRRPVCELCGYCFEFLPVYAQHAPQRLTVADWAGALGVSAFSTGKRLLRIAYATTLWGVALPLLTVMGTHLVFTGRVRLPSAYFRNTLTFMLNVFLGEFLSLAGIALIYLASASRGPASASLGGSADAGSGPAAGAAVAADAPAAPSGELGAEQGRSEPIALGPQPLEQDGGRPHESGQLSSPASGECDEAELGMPEPGSEASPTTARPQLAADTGSAAAQAAPSTAEAAVPAPLGGGAVQADDEHSDPEEDLWNIMGLQGNPLRALFCMATFLCANLLGTISFLAIPFFTGRFALRVALPLLAGEASALDAQAGIAGGAGGGLDRPSPLLLGVEAGAVVENAAGAAASASTAFTAGAATTQASFGIGGAWAALGQRRALPPAGQSQLLDVVTLLAGYVTLAAAFFVIVPFALLVASALGCTSRGPEVVRAGATAFAARARRALLQAWSKLQTFAVVLLQLVLVPCYIGHLVVCLLCGPVLHISQHARASMANANMPLTLVMQLFIGYVHLWGVAFLEGCVVDVLVPAIVRRASSNFYIGAICSHRRLFGTGTPSESGGGMVGSPVLAPHIAALKLALVLVALHTPLAFVLWHMPAKMLDTVLGKALFPVHLVDRSAGVWGAGLGSVGPGAAAVAARAEAARRELSFAPGFGGSSPASSRSRDGDGQEFFAIEMLQLYFLILQCLHVLAASPGLARLVASGLRMSLRALGLGHMIAQELPAQSPAQVPASFGLLRGASAAGAAARPFGSSGGVRVRASSQEHQAIEEATSCPGRAGGTPTDGNAFAIDGTSSLLSLSPMSSLSPLSPVLSLPAPSPSATPDGSVGTPSTFAARSPGALRPLDLPESRLGDIVVVSDTMTSSPAVWLPMASARPPEACWLRPPLWRLSLVVLMLILLVWGIMFLVLALPLAVGRALVNYIWATQAKRLSDFLPLSLGVVVFSASILATVKLIEALPAVVVHASSVQQNRFAHMLACAISSLAAVVASLVFIPLSLGTLLLNLVLPLKASSVFQVPIVFPVTDCWSLGLVLTKVVWRLVQTDIVLHNLHEEFTSIWSQVQGSAANLFFDLGAHSRIWRSLLLPVVSDIILHLIFPQALAHTLVHCCIPEEMLWSRATCLMYCYHVVLGVRLWLAAVPLVDARLREMRQRIFDDKYLVSTELQNYHPFDGVADA